MRSVGRRTRIPLRRGDERSLGRGRERERERERRAAAVVIRAKIETTYSIRPEDDEDDVGDDGTHG